MLKIKGAYKGKIAYNYSHGHTHLKMMELLILMPWLLLGK